MKAFFLLPLLLGILLVEGCRSYEGGTADDYDYRNGTERSSDLNRSTWPNQPATSPTIPQPLPPP